MTPPWDSNALVTPPWDSNALVTPPWDSNALRVDGVADGVSLPTTPFAEDQAVCHFADQFGLSLSRYEAIEITDLPALKSAGLVVSKPDYGAIRKALRDGVEVPGAKLRGVEYILRRTE